MAKSSRLDEVETMPAKVAVLAHNVARPNTTARNFIITPFYK